MKNIIQYDKLKELVTYIESCLIEYEKLDNKLVEIQVQRDLHAAQETPATDQIKDFIELEEIIEKQLSLVLYTAIKKLNEFKKETE